MKILSDEEVFGAAKSTVMSDEEVFGTPKTAPSATKPISDAEVFAKPSSSPEAQNEVTPTMTPAVTRAPLPSERPTTAPPRAEAIPLPQERPVEAGPRAEPAATVDPSQPLYDEIASVGRSFKRGVHELRQGGNVIMAGAEARPLNNLTEVERRLAAGEEIPDKDDLFGARFMTPEQRAGLRTELETNIKGSVQGIVERQKDIAQYPAPLEVQKVTNAKTFREGWEAFKEAPGTVIAHLGASSLPQAAPAIAGSLVAGPVGGLAAAGGAVGLGSYGTDYASEILDGLREAKVDLSNPQAIEAALNDPVLMERIGQKAHSHAAVVGAVDAMSLKLAGTSMLPKAVRPGNVVAEKLAELPIQAPLQGAVGAFGEFGGQQAAGDPIKPGAIMAEFFGEFAGTPTEVASAVLAKDAPTAAKPESVTPVTEAQIAASGVPTHTPEVYGPPEMYGPPAPTGVPVTTSDGVVQTTSVVEGVAEAYEVIFGPGGKPQIVPAAAPMPVNPVVETMTTSSGYGKGFDAIDYADPWAQEVYAETTKLFPLVDGGMTPQAAAFENGAHGLPWDMGLPADVPQQMVAMAYSSGAAFALMKGPKAHGQNGAATPKASDPATWADTASVEATTMYPDDPVQAQAFYNGAQNQHWMYGMPDGTVIQDVLDAYDGGLIFYDNHGPGAKAAQRATPEWATTGSPADASMIGTALTAPAFVTTQRPLGNDPNWTQPQTVPGPRDSFTEIRVQVPAKATSTGVGGIVTMPITTRSSVDGHTVALVEGMPDAPSEVGFTRSVIWAARQGIGRVAWTGKFAPSARKLARKLGGTMGSTRVPIARPQVIAAGTTMDPLTGALAPVWAVVSLDTGKPFVTTPDRLAAEEVAEKNTTYAEVPVLTLPPVALDTMLMPVPYTVETFSESQGAALSGNGSTNPLTKASVEPLVKALNTLIKRLDLGISVTVVVHDGAIKFQEADPANPGKLKWNVSQSLGVARSLGKTPWTKLTKYSDIVAGEIHVSLAQHSSATGVWATMVHEMGHLVMNTIYQRASDAVKTAIHAGYQEYFKSMNINMTMEEVYRLQSNAAFIIDRVLNKSNSTMTLSQMTQDQVDYWVGKSEWFAEQVAKWATTQQQPLTVLEKFFKGMASRLLAMLKVASDMFGMKFEPVPALTAFLNDAMTNSAVVAGIVATTTENTQATTKSNATQMAPEDTAVEQQPETVAGDTVVKGAFNGRPPKEAQEASAYADKFNRLWKYFTGIHQLAVANSHIQSLQTYVETVRIAQQTKNAIMSQAEENLKKWNNLGETQGNAVAALLDDVQSLSYLTPEEAKRKVSRHPTMAELTAMAKTHGVSQAGLAVYAQIGKSFQDFLTRLEAVGKAEAMKISDQTRRDLKLAGIAKQIAALRSKPYFPAMRFGSYTLTIRNAAKQVVHFETFESVRQRRSAMRAIAASYNVDPADMQIGFLDKSVKPLLGVPTALLELIGEKLQLNATQKDSLQQLKYELSPAESFKHRFQHKKRVAGYSMDFRRAYANYFFHGANHLMKAQHADRMRALAKMIKQEAGATPDITKRQQIVAQVDNHLEHWLDPKPDWAAIRSVAFLLHLAFSPAAAMQNLSQTVMTTHPFLASKFGRLNSIPAIIKAGRGLENFYKKRTLEKHTNFAQKALYQGMTEGVIKETQATELAGFADGDILGKGYGGNKIQRGWVKFNEWGAFMFEMAEQFNRRIVFRATLDLALANPNAKYVREAVAKRKLTYDQRRAEGWTEAEAAAYVTAVDATSETQFEYGKEFAPRVMRGRARSLLVFKTFQQSYIMFLVNNPGARYESLLILAFLGGFMALPGGEDLQEILQAIGYRLFGKDFKIEHEARKWIIELLGSNESGDLAADLLLHGTAKRGYGIPHIMDMLAGTVGVDSPVPMFDRSKSVSAGTILPIELGKLFGPPLQSQEKIIAGQAQKASGAVFGVGFAAYKAATNTQLSWTDFKRWEPMMPRAISNVSKAVRAATEGGTRTNTGDMIVEYNVRDPQGAAEVIGMAMGYKPYRENYEWEKAMSKHDAAKMIDIQREQLLRQFSNAVLGKDPEEKSRMKQTIRDWNAQLQPDERAKAITGETLTKSVETKATNRALRDRGLPTRSSDVPLYRAEDKLYPGQHRTLRPVSGALKP